MTTTTNNNKPSFDLSAIMTRAHVIRRENSTDGIPAVWGMCVAMAWAEAKGQHAAHYAAEIVSEWHALTAAKQMRFMTACVVRAARDTIGYSVADQYLQFNEVPAWGLHGHDFDEFINETWIRLSGALSAEKLTAVNEKRAARGLSPLPLVKLVYNAAKAAISAIYYADHKHGRAAVRTITDDKGVEHAYTETMVKAPASDTASRAILRVLISDVLAARDAVDQSIVNMLWLGFTEREIGQHLGMSGPAINKRKKGLRAAFSAAMAA